MEQASGKAVPLQPVHYGLAQVHQMTGRVSIWPAGDPGITASLSGSPGVCIALAQPITAMPAWPDPPETNMPLLLSPQVLGGLRGAVSASPWQQKQAIRALRRNAKAWGS